VSPLHLLLSPFIREVGREVFIISLGGASVYKRTNRSYKWALKTLSHKPFHYVIGTSKH
jgi:hypothetical protein